MSDARPFTFRNIDEPERPKADGSVSLPNWLAPRDAQIRPAAFATPQPAAPVTPGARELETAQQDAVGLGTHPSFAANQALSRRSSLPPRNSVFPPPVVISRLPPPPAIAVEEEKPSAEQEAFALAALELGSLRARILSGVESELLQLSVHIAQTIIEREVSLDPSLHTTLARTAVLALGDTQSARLRVSRAAYRAISELYGEAAIDVDGVRVELSMDASFDALSVVAEAGPSRVDGRLSERLSAVLRAMEAEHRRKNAEIASVDVP